MLFNKTIQYNIHIFHLLKYRTRQNNIRKLLILNESIGSLTKNLEGRKYFI